MQKNKNIWMLLGFLFIILGFTSLILSLVGTRWVFLGWIDALGALPAFVLKIFMVMMGVVLFVIARTDWEREHRESR
jgi:uncharacterized membrane protein